MLRQGRQTLVSTSIGMYRSSAQQAGMVGDFSELCCYACYSARDGIGHASHPSHPKSRRGGSTPGLSSTHTGGSHETWKLHRAEAGSFACLLKPAASSTATGCAPRRRDPRANVLFIRLACSFFCGAPSLRVSVLELLKL